MKYALLVLVSTTLLFATDFEGGTEFLANEHWNGGGAEYQIYRMTDKPHYGQPRDGEVTMVIVKEPFDKSKGVKTRRGGVPVIKLNLQRTFQTGIYTYYQMASIFFDIESGDVFFQRMNSQEMCGVASMTYRRGPFGGSFDWNTYFDDQGRVRKTHGMNNKVFYDALPVMLRYRLEDGVSYPLTFVSSQLANKVRPIEDTTAMVQVTQTNEHFDVQVHSDKGVDYFLFEAEFPHTLVSATYHDGTKLELARDHYLAYWKTTGNEDEHLADVNASTTQEN